MASDKAAAAVPAIMVSNHGHVHAGNLSQGAATPRSPSPNLRSSLSRGLLPLLKSGRSVGEADNELSVEDVNEVEADLVFDDAVPEGDADNQDISETELKEGPDLSVLDLFLKQFELRANPLGVARFSH